MILFACSFVTKKFMTTTDSYILIKVSNQKRQRRVEVEEISTYEKLLNLCRSLINNQERIKQIYYKDSNTQKIELLILHSYNYKEFLLQCQCKILRVFIDVKRSNPTTNRRFKRTDFIAIVYKLMEQNKRISKKQDSFVTKNKYLPDFKNFLTIFSKF